MIQLLSINNIFFTIFGYSMSYLEFFGTILNILSVYLVSKNKILNWPIGIIASMLFMFLFWQIQLYSDFTEQIYYIITGFYGWIVWSLGKKSVLENKVDLISYTSHIQKLYLGTIVVIGTVICGYFTSHMHLIWSALPPASYAYLDAFTTILSFVATYLLIARKVESWYIWIFVDIIAIWLYFVKGVVFVSILYMIFLCLATYGLINWIKLSKS